MRFLLNYYKTFFSVIFILFLSFFPFKNTDQNGFLNIENLDKIVHFLMYAFLSFIIFFDLKKVNKKCIVKILLILSILIFSAIVEILQEFVFTERDGNIYDLAANAVGILIGYLLFQIFFQK